jgi:hypothetical protein
MIQDYSYSNCKISNPIVQPGRQTVTFNGMAWSSTGMMHEITDVSSNESWQQWLGTQQ